MRKFRFLLLALAATVAVPFAAVPQVSAAACVETARRVPTPADVASQPERYAGIYRSYEPCAETLAPVPEGLVPFYISHYGRHGSRWHIGSDTYTEPVALLREAAEAGALTPLGADVLRRLEIVAADAAGREGALTPRGVEEQRGIAERMYAAYPEVFDTSEEREVVVESRSTTVPRVILSMAAFNERLKELDPAIRTTREANRRWQSYLSHTPAMDSLREASHAVTDSLRGAWLRPGRLMGALFDDPGFVRERVEDPVATMYRFYLLAAIMQDVDYLGISLYDLFTADELFALWQAENARSYLSAGPSGRFGAAVRRDARPLLRNIVRTSQRVIDGRERIAASLRFGHDVNLMPLAALMGIEGASEMVPAEEAWRVWDVSRVSPMAGNVQLIFFRDVATGEVRVRVLLNECDAVLPLPGGPFYPWEALRDYLEARGR